MRKSLFIYPSLLFAFILLIIGPNPTTQAAGILQGKIICIDPGHGGSDPGAINNNFNLKESEINLDVSFGLEQLLANEGATVFLTRNTDIHPDGPDYTWSNNDRYTFCNQVGADILVSVHTNSVTDPTWDGSLVLYGPKKSPELAQAIYDIMFPYLRDNRTEGMPNAEFTDYGLDRYASGVLFKSNMPAAMVEPLFLSQPDEAELLVEPIFNPGTSTLNITGCNNYSCRRGQIAKTVYGGIFNYFGLSAGNSFPPSVNIDSPADGAGFSSGSVINFSATASDIQGGDLTASIIWTSDLDGQIGVGGLNNIILSKGTHLITAGITNNFDQTSSETITVIVEGGGSSGNISLTVDTYKTQGSNFALLSWSGASSTSIDIKRDGSLITTTSAVSIYEDGPLGKGHATASYQVCEAGTANCSDIVDVSW